MKKLMLFLFLGIMFINFSSAYIYDDFTDGSVNWSFWRNASSYGGSSFSYTEASSQLRITADNNNDGSNEVWSENLINPLFIKSINTSLQWALSCGNSCTAIGTLQLFNQTVFTIDGGENGLSGSTNIAIYRNPSGTFHVYNGTAFVSNITVGAGRSVYISTTGSGSSPYVRQWYLGQVTYETYGVWNNLTSPPNNSLINSAANFTVNNTAILEMNLTNVTYNIYRSNGTLYNRTITSITGKSNTTNIEFNFNNDTGSYIWSANTCGTNGTYHTCYNFGSNYSFTYGLIENSITYNASTIETSTESFILNTTLSNVVSLSSAIFYYNNTAYPSTKVGSGLNVRFENTISVPAVDSTTNKDFYWTLNLDGNLINSSINSQTVNTLNLGLCNATQTVPVLNFTAALETNLTRVNPFSFAGTFEYFIGTGTTTKTQSVSLPSTPEAVICMSSNNTITLDAEIDYGFEDANLTLVSRKYFFDDAEITNATQNITLLLLDSEDATTFILKVRDNTLQPVADALIYIQRYYPGEGIFRTVQIAKTDDNGASVGFYQTETVTYKHIIVKDGVVLLDTGTGGVVVGESVPFTLTFTVGDTLPAPWEFLEENSTIQTSLSYNETSELVVFAYIDPTGSSNFGRLNVYQESLSNSTVTTICDTSTTGSSATITCNMSGQTGTFIAKGYVTTSTSLQKIIRFIIDSARQIFDKTGAFLGWIILLTVSMAFLWNPSVAIILINCTIIFLGVIGLLVFSPVAYFSIIGISIILLILFKT